MGLQKEGDYLTQGRKDAKIFKIGFDFIITSPSLMAKVNFCLIFLLASLRLCVNFSVVLSVLLKRDFSNRLHPKNKPDTPWYLQKMSDR
jgi:hypothetical protein